MSGDVQRLNDAEVASRVLAQALEELAPRRTPCQHPARRDDWHAEHRSARAAAALACQPCPVLDLCAEYADAAGEAWGVWGGRDVQTGDASARATASRRVS